MEDNKKYQADYPFQPTSQLQAEIGSSAGAYQHLDNCLQDGFDLTAFYQFVEMTIIMRRMDEIEGVIRFGDEEEQQKRFDIIAGIYADPDQAEMQKQLMETYGYQSTLYVLLIIMRLLKQESELADAVERFKSNTPETSHIWADYQWFLYLRAEGRDDEAKRILEKIRMKYAWNDRFDIHAVDLKMITMEAYAKRALSGPSREVRNRCLQVIASGATAGDVKDFNFADVLKEPMIYDDEGILMAKEFFLDKSPESDKWIQLFEAWHGGTYKDYIAQLKRMETEEEPGEQDFAKWLSVWRYLWLIGDYRQMITSIKAREDDFGEAVYAISMRAMKAMAIAKVYGHYEGYRSIRGVWNESLIHYGARYGEKALDSILLIETAIITKDEEVFFEILHRTQAHSWNYWWVLGRIQEYGGKLEEAKESYLSVLNELKQKNELFLFSIQAYERLALIAYELGEVSQGKEYEERFVACMHKLKACLGDMDDMIDSWDWSQESAILWEENWERRVRVLEAKRLLAEGRVQKSSKLMQELLASYRLRGQTDYYEYGILEKDYITQLLQMGQLTEAKDEIERLPDKRLIERMSKAGFLIQWASLLGDDEVLRENQEWLACEIKETQDFPKIWLENLKVAAMLTELTERKMTEQEYKQLEKKVNKEKKTVLELQSIIAKLTLMEAQRLEVPVIWQERIKADLSRLGNPLHLEIAWLKLQARQAENPVDILRSRLMLLQDNYGNARMETLHAWMDWIEQMPETWMEELKCMIQAAKEALVERVSSVPMERQMHFAEELVALYERVCLFGLNKQEPALLELLVPWTYQIKGFSMRIQYFAVWRMRQRNRRSDYLKFADLSQRIADQPMDSQEDRSLLRKLRAEREGLLKSLSIYQDFAVEIGAGALVPTLPKRKWVLEFVVTGKEVFSFENDEAGWRYRHLGANAEWERRILRFRRNLKRGKADFEGMALELFGKVDKDQEISWAPDGMFFTLPFSELFAEVGIQDYEIWPNHLYGRNGKRKFHASSGTMLVASDVEGRPKLEFANREVWEMIKMGIQPLYANRRKEFYLRDYRGFFHFSGHGEMAAPSDGRSLNPFVSSRLVLPQRQVITALDFSILNWSQCPLVFLNACESGGGSYVSSQGVLGLSYGLFLGGAETLIVTQYPVEDRIAMWFSAVFYDALFQTKSRHYAFLVAKQTLSDNGISEKELSAFQLIGSGDELLETRISRLTRLIRMQSARWRLRGKEGAEEIPTLGEILKCWIRRKRGLARIRWKNAKNK